MFLNFILRVSLVRVFAVIYLALQNVNETVQEHYTSFATFALDLKK